MARLEQLQVLRGIEANIPVLNDGEFYFLPIRADYMWGLVTQIFN
jgi:hypothetical protein